MSTASFTARWAKYDVPGPRYTSYPTVPYWEDTPSELVWLERVKSALVQGESLGQGASVYVHIPFCRALCTFCGCNTRVTRAHTVIGPYSQAVLKEFSIYRERLGSASLPVSEFHLGGGTPTFLDAGELDALIGGLLSGCQLHPQAALSIEADPRVTSIEHLQVLSRLGFRRISFGVQDFDPKVQNVVNRVQSVEQVRAVTELSRAAGFTGVNFDLIYGLPLQTLASIDLTLGEVCRLRPDRVAFYGYAHVPWIKSGQRRFTEADLPEGAAKRALYERGRHHLEAAGYREIGFDHFALPQDTLWQAAASGTLHRNFMGYAERPTQPLIGLGVSAIGDAGDALVQNEKDLQQYQERIARGELPIHRGHVLDAEDQVLRRHVLNLMTRGATDWNREAAVPFLDAVPARLAELARDGLIELEPKRLRITEVGRGFLRNICMAFDARLMRRSPDRPLFNERFNERRADHAHG